MPQTKDPRVYLLHIRDALDCISQYTAEGEKQFLANSQSQDAVLYNLAIIGEAVKKLPRSFREDHPAVPWKKIAGTRDVVIHNYDGTEIVQVWHVVENDLPANGSAATLASSRSETPLRRRRWEPSPTTLP